MNREMPNRLKVFLFGKLISSIQFISFCNGTVNKKSVVIENNADGGSKVLAVEMDSGKIISRALSEAISNYGGNEISEYYFIMKKKQHIRPVMDVIRKHSLGTYDLYGIDPDYFYTFVPLTGKNHRIVEKYIASMKTDCSIQGLVKAVIKKLLISINCSYRLYEGFLVVVSKKDREASGESAGC